MRVSSILFGLSAMGATLTAAAPTSSPAGIVFEERAGTCTSPLQRKEWRTLGLIERASYLLSVSCMMVKPSRHPEFPLAKTRWEDMIMIHKTMTPKVHFVGQFLPWHRMFLHHFETVLRNECLYRGALPYWDMSIDVAGGWENSPVLDNFLGFGGDGVEIGGQPGAPGTTGGGCISSGIFKNLKTNIPNLDSLTPLAKPRCVTRARDMMAITSWMGANRINDVLSKTTFEEFAVALEGDVDFTDLYTNLGIHNAGHGAVGGDMIDMYVSTGDPLFYLHHANVDRLWYQWQTANPSARNYAVGNPIAPRPNPSLIWLDPPAGNVTPAYQLQPFKVSGTETPITVGHVLNTKGKGVAPPGGGVQGVLCYEYVI